MKTVLLIDGGYLRACSRGAGHVYDNAFIVAFARRCSEAGEEVLRILYYDSPEFRGRVQLPVSGGYKAFSASDKWLSELAQNERFAVRRGTIGFRGWRVRNVPLNGGAPLQDDDFAPVFEQKGVDMRIGLDIAVMAEHRTTARILMVSGDTDMVPALKAARRSGIEVGMIQLDHPTRGLHYALKEHSDFLRAIAWA